MKIKKKNEKVMSSSNETNIALYQQMVQNVQQTAGKIKL